MIAKKVWGALLLAVPVVFVNETSAQTDCTRVPIQRAVPGGDTVQAFRLVCEESPDEGLLAADAVQAVCGSRDLPSDRVVACEEAVARAQAAFRKAKLRAALRDGAKDEDLRQRYDASAADLDRLRESALQSAPVEP